MVQVEAMREQIRILEGIWGGDPDEPANALHGHGTPDRGGSEWTVLSKGGDSGPETDKKNRAQSEGRGGVVDAVEQGGEGEARIGNTSGSSKAGDRGITEGEGTDSGERGTHEGMNERVGNLAEETAGNDEEGGRGTEVDAWLISYNRRLKNELQRLRNKARLAEERWVREAFLCLVYIAKLHSTVMVGENGPGLFSGKGKGLYWKRYRFVLEKGTGLYWNRVQVCTGIGYMFVLKRYSFIL